ncbi:hypothetical protein ACLOJK_007684 [Asimina triloba]
MTTEPNRELELKEAWTTPKKAIDKGKAPMRDDDEQRTTGMITRSRGLGITIREIQEDMRSGVRETEQRTVPTVEPQAEQRAGEMQGIKTAQTEGNDRGHQQAGTSGTTAPFGMEEVSQTQLAEAVQLMMGALHQIIETRSQPRALTGPDPSTVLGARAEVPVQRPGREDADVEVVDIRPHMEERRRRIQDERADMKAFQDMHPPAYQGEMDYKAVDKWLSKMEKIFKYLQCTDKQKVWYVTFMLEGDAEK